MRDSLSDQGTGDLVKFDTTVAVHMSPKCPSHAYVANAASVPQEVQ